jgi:hypothetical protein
LLNAGNGIVSTLTVSNSTLSGNSATGTFGLGGGIYNDFIGTVTVRNSTLTGNSALDGGGIYNGIGTVTVSDSTLSGNSATESEYYNANGGAIYTSGTVTVTGSTLSGNAASGDGGGIYNRGVNPVWTVTVAGSTLSGNTAAGSGGGIANSGTLTITGSTLSGNSASGSLDRSYGGGGIYNDNYGTVTVSNSTLSGNSATGSGYYNGNGGAISNFGTVTVTGSTLSGNSAFVSGGGIYAYMYFNRVTLTNVTLTANRATNGGGLYVYFPTPTAAPVLHNTLIAGNFRGATGTTRDDVYGRLDPGGDYNLIGDGTGMTGISHGVNGNLVGSASSPIDPLLGPLQDNGGPTQTMALLAGSPALNAGDPAQLGVADQRGVVRTGGVNIGAYQASASALRLSAPDTVTAGMPFDVTVTAVDLFGLPAVGYTGTVTFGTSDADPGVVLPADYAFTLIDGGTHRFTDTGRGETTLVTPGPQMLTVMDTADNAIAGSANVTVSAAPAPAPPGQRPPPSPSPASSAQAEPPPRSEPAANAVTPAEQWLSWFQDGDSAWLTVARLKHQALRQTDLALTEQIDWA